MSNTTQTGSSTLFQTGTGTLTTINQSGITLPISTLGSVAAAHIISNEEHEFFTEARNFIMDIASSEEVPAGFREQAQRMVARLVMRKL